jgi:hypothetical protein
MSDEKIAHLGFIQAVVSRMATNCFLLKGWSVTLVAAIFALSADKSNLRFLIVAFFPAVLFWVLDAYFFWHEKLFRQLYEKVADGTIDSQEFTLKTNGVRASSPSMFRLIFSIPLLVFHGAILGGIAMVSYFLGAVNFIGM